MESGRPERVIKAGAACREAGRGGECGSGREGGSGGEVVTFGSGERSKLLESERVICGSGQRAVIVLARIGSWFSAVDEATKELLSTFHSLHTFLHNSD